MNPQRCERNRQGGVSLVELMVSLTLGVILSLGVVNLFLQSKTSYYQDEETAQLQENGRWALRYVARELSMTGFMGGIIDGEAVTTTLLVADDCATGWASKTSEALEHLDNPTDTEATTTYGCLGSGEVKPGTDIIAVRRTKDTPHVSDGTVLADLLDNALYLRVEDFGAASTLVKGSAVTGADKTAGSKVDVWQYQPQLLFIRPWSLAAGDGVPTLCRKTLTTSAVAVALDEPECLVEGIENMQVEFGVDNSNPLDYVPEHYEVAPTAAELERAVTARIYLLARSINQVAGYTNDKSYTLGATTVAAADDGFYRRVLQTTIMLRNSEAFGF